MLWQNVKEILKAALPERDFHLWFEPLKCIRHTEDCLDLTGPDKFFCTWLMDNYRPQIQKALSELGQGHLQVKITPNGSPAERPESPEIRADQLRLPEFPERRVSNRTLHPRYTFEEFMVGESNVMAHSACHNMTANGDSISPCLFIEAGTGLGKSHLTHAIGHHFNNYAPQVRYQCVTAQQFTAEIVRNIKQNTLDHFKEKYHNQCDFLMIDDVQTLAGKTRTQAELAEMVDILLDRGKKVIYTGSRPPHEMNDLDGGLRSRFSAGLVTAINPPDFMTRKKIIERKAKNYALRLNEDLVLFLAEKIRGDIRRVESAVVGLKAKSSLFGYDPDLDMVKELIVSFLGSGRDLNLESIRDFIAVQFKVPVKEMLSKTRRKEIAFPRQLSMYLSRKLTEQSLGDIGKAFNRDHSTVVHSIKVINDAIARDGSIRGQVELLTEKLKQRYN